MRAPSFPWTNTDDIFLREKIASCDSLKDVLTFFPNRTYSSIQSRCRILGIQMKVLPTYDKHCFDEPSEKNCAVAGFITTNASISSGAPRLIFNMGAKDKDHLAKVLAFIRYTGNIYEYNHNSFAGSEKTYPLIRVQITCPEACAKLKQHWNIMPHKTETLLPPNLIDDRHIAAYISGFIDGQGWVSETVSEDDPTKYMIGFAGSKVMLDWIKSHLDRWIPDSGAAEVRYKEADHTYNYHISGAKTYWLSKMLLSLNIVRMERKWSKLARCVELYESGNASSRALTAARGTIPSPEAVTMFGLEVAVSLIQSVETKRVLEIESRPKYDYDRQFFANMTHEACYWAALICTDGHLGERGNAKIVKWSVARKDRWLLELFRKRARLEQPISDFEAVCLLSTRDPLAKHPQSRVSIEAAHQWHEDLKRNFNITPNKTFRCSPPNFPSTFHALCFIRGFIDGDGCITKSDQDGSLTIMVCGVNREMIAWVKKTIDDLGLPSFDRGREAFVSQREGEQCYYHQVRGFRAAILFSLLRRLPTPNLARKWDNPAILEAVSYWSSRPDIWPSEQYFTDLLSRASIPSITVAA